MDGSTETIEPRVAYIWSQSLQDAADQLPANVGRSSRVHGLIAALGLLHREEPKQDSVSVDRRVQLDREDSEESDAALELPVSLSSKGKGRATVVAPDVALGSETALKRYHEAGYVDYLLAPPDEAASDRVSDEESSDSSSSSAGVRPRKRQKQEYHGLQHDCPPFAALHQYATLVAASTQTACRLLASGQADIAINWDGGRHHAMRNCASGFCYVADIVLGVMLLSKEGRARGPASPSGNDGMPPPASKQQRRPRILYLDFDLHYGDGVAQAFHSPSTFPTNLPKGKRPPRPPQVLTLSVHHSSPIFFPPRSTLSGLPNADTKHPFSLSVPLAAYPGAASYARVFRGCVEPVMRAFDPDYIVLQLGADGLPGDWVGQYGNWSIEGEGGMAWIAEQAKNWGRPLCVLGGGGYEHAQTARAWAAVTSVLVDKPMPPTQAIPHHPYFPEYGPSFTLEGPSSESYPLGGMQFTFGGHVSDENSAETLAAAEQVFSTIAQRIRGIVHAWS